MSPDEKDFLLHLYDKLWDNINQKESRVWTFLSVYGAVIGLALGSGAVVSLGAYGVLAALLLTYWAVRIVLDADWWSIRNRMMVGAIEAKCPGAFTGVVPSHYQQPRYSSEALNRVSLLLFTVIALLLYWKTLMTYSQPGAIGDLLTLGGIVVLHLLFVALSVIAVTREEEHLREYYRTYKDLYPQAAKLLDEEAKDRSTLKLRLKLGLLVAAALVPVYWLFFTAPRLARSWLILAALLVLAAVCIVIWMSRDYYRRPIDAGKEDCFALSLAISQGKQCGWKDHGLRWAAAGLFALSCLALCFSGLGKLSWTAPPTTAQVAEGVAQLQADLAALQTKVAEVRRQISAQQQYLGRAEAERLYLKTSDPRLAQALGALARATAEVARSREQTEVMLREIERLRQQAGSRSKPP